MKTRKNPKPAATQKKTLNTALLLLLTASVVLVSGCIVPGGDVFQGMFAPQRPATTEASADLITTQNVNIIPNPPISASTDSSKSNTFTVSFEVKNNDEKQEVDNVNIENYDSGKCVQGEVTSTGVSRTSSSASVEKISDTNVFQFKVTGGTCASGVEYLYVDEKMSDNIKVCGPTEREYKVKDLGAVPVKDSIGNILYNIYKLRLTVDGHDIDIPYAADDNPDTTIADSYNCLRIVNPNAACSVTDGGITYQAYDKIKTSKTNCISSTGTGDATICTTKGGCSDYCQKQNTECKNKCTQPEQAVKESCINQCEVYKYVVKKNVNANCFWYLGYGKVGTEKNYVGYEGQCCVCGYTVPKLGTKKTTTVSAGEGDTFMPLQTELNEWQFTAPTNEELGNMPGSCGIKYKITYDFTAKTQASVDVINADKLKQMQRAGETPSSSPTQFVGIGPIKVFFDFGASQPVRSGDVLPIFITVEDGGSGLLDSGDVDAGSLRLTIPSDFDPVAVGCSKFKQSGDEWENGAAIPMIKKRSPQLRCSFKMPEVTDIKTFYISAELGYTYKLDDEIKVAINPTLVR